ncbi:MAG: hypothetical protein ABIR30_03325 [Chitinophagaceae bacterium]
MKNLRTSVLCSCIILCGFYAGAQNTGNVPVNEPNYNKPKLFQGQPDLIQLSTENLNNLFTKQVGQPVRVQQAGISFQFDGEIISTVSKYNNSLQSVVVRSTNFNGARLTISKLTDENGNTLYRGRIISLQHGDLYELQNNNGSYELVKRNFYDLVNE